MIQRIIISILIVLLNNGVVLANNDANELPTDNDTSVVSNNNSSSLSDSLSFTTALINSLNNTISVEEKHLAAMDIIITILAVILTIIGFIGIKGMNDYKKETNNELKEYKECINIDIDKLKVVHQRKIDEINRLKASVEDKTQEIKDILKKQEYQNQYLQRINSYLFSVTNSIVDSKDPNEPQTSIIRKSLYNQYHIIKLYLPWTEGDDGTEADFMYLKANGTKDNIDDLQYIADKDPDERKRKLAIETIGFIQANEINNPSA